jgi:hypothetical protein
VIADANTTLPRVCGTLMVHCGNVAQDWAGAGGKLKEFGRYRHDGDVHAPELPHFF